MSKNETTLITVLGSSPQVITETLYALKEAGFPNRIIVFTTKHGASQIEQLALHEHIESLCENYGLSVPTLNEHDINIVKDLNGIELNDIRNSADQESMADQITQTVRELVKDDKISIHASIAGGRKSMSFYMGYIFSIFARPQDSLSHVLVSPEFESNNFWYPTPKSSPFVAKIIRETGEKIMLDAQHAKVELAEIPFLRINNALVNQGDLLTKDASYRQTLAAYQLALTPEKVILEFTSDYRVLVNGNELSLSVETIAFYRVIARSCINTPIYTRNKIEALESPFLEELAIIGNTDITGELAFDKLDEIEQGLQFNTDFSVNKRLFTSIEEKGLSISLEGGMKTEILSALKTLAVGTTVTLCEVCIVKPELSANNQRSRTKGGVLGVQLNPQQIIFT
jgi:CRISPR-associated protein (TIGR02584 family)